MKRTSTAKRAPFWLVAAVIGGFLAVVGVAIGMCVVGEDRRQAQVTTLDDRCVESALERLTAMGEARRDAFSAELDEARELVELGQVAIVYAEGAIEHEAGFRVEADEVGGCRLLLYREEARAEGAAPNRRRGRLASSPLPGCGCE